MPSSASGSWASTTWPRPAKGRSRSRSPRIFMPSPPGTPIPPTLVKAVLDRGQSVVVLDPLLVGESLDPAAPAERRPSTVHYDTYNPTLAEDRAQDLATVLAWTKALPDVREVSLVAEAGIGPLALLARPALEGLSRTAIDLGEFDYGD